MRLAKLLFPALLLSFALPLVAETDSKNAPPPNAAPASFDQVVDRITAREHATLQELRKYAPVVETYIQNMRPDRDLGYAPESDTYFLGRMDMSKGARRDRSYMPRPSFMRAFRDKLTQFYSLKYLPLGFMQMIVMDDSSFDRAHYDFKFVRREFIGDVRCLVIDVSPKRNAGKGRFLGRIWAEDQNFNIVRFNGSYGPPPHFSTYLHFDSWRLNMQPGLWLPAYVYSEESQIPERFGLKMLRFKSQTRLWGYDEAHIGHHEEFSTITVDSPRVKDESQAAQDANPQQAQRAWEHMAESNVLDRLEVAGLLAPEGDVDKVLNTVINNLEVTNQLNIQPEVRARVLLTAPLESFTVGHTIVLSRGLIDVLPDEATLAAVVAHELAHISLGHELDTRFAFSDRMIFPDEQTFQRLAMRRAERDEAEADARAVAFLRNSPYKDKLGNAGLFLEALKARERQLPNLLRAHLGNSMELRKGNLRMRDLMNGAPQLQIRNKDQVAALPLGARLRLDPWSDRLERSKTPRVALISAREKMPFEVTPFYPYVSRYGAEEKKVATAAGNQ